ncbi:mitochondrial inner membrane protease subunit 1-like [Lineus longissimus]|uniref:mitochondrial inner membrane protease subunit 1-like n=1 Tax=Lineus longissimus TaxID=88925 RepID=UPI002B4D97D5
MWGRLFRRSGTLAFNVVKYGCLAHISLEMIGGPIQCEGPSMQPTIQSNDFVLTEAMSVRCWKIGRGDVVISQSPLNPHQQICKRVTATEGDRIRLGNSDYRFVPKGHVWLEGDNKDNSKDSRDYGPVPMGLIKQRVFLRVWPLLSFKRISSLPASENVDCCPSKIYAMEPWEIGYDDADREESETGECVEDLV